MVIPYFVFNCTIREPQTAVKTVIGWLLVGSCHCANFRVKSTFTLAASPCVADVGPPNFVSDSMLRWDRHRMLLCKSP